MPCEVTVVLEKIVYMQSWIQVAGGRCMHIERPAATNPSAHYTSTTKLRRPASDSEARWTAASSGGEHCALMVGSRRRRLSVAPSVLLQSQQQMALPLLHEVAKSMQPVLSSLAYSTTFFFFFLERERKKEEKKSQRNFKFVSMFFVSKKGDLSNPIVTS